MDKSDSVVESTLTKQEPDRWWTKLHGSNSQLAYEKRKESDIVIPQAQDTHFS